MLSEADKARVRAEEIFRQEVRSELDKGEHPLSRKVRLWGLLNSSFALWFLSSVVLAGLAAGVSWYQGAQQREQQRARVERLLDTELRNRILQAAAGIETDRKRLELGEIHSPLSYYSNVTRYLNNGWVSDPAAPADFSLFPEYRLRTFRSLISELQMVVEESQKSELSDALLAYEDLVDLGSVDENTVGETESTARSTLDHCAVITTRLLISRWKDPQGRL